MGERRPSLRARLPDYAAVFVAGLLGASAVGLLIAALTDAPAASAVGYSTMLLGVLMAFAGGAAGGGLSSYGVGEGVLRRTYLQGPASDQRHYHETGVDPVERIRVGMRPRPNPGAFWQVIGGLLYIAVGLLVVTLG